MNPTISLAPSGNLFLEIPSVLAEGRSHTVEIPLSLSGLSLLKKVLTERAKAADLRIGTLASPVASDIERFLRQRQAEDRIAAREVVKALAPELEEIELEL